MGYRQREAITHISGDEQWVIGSHKQLRIYKMASAMYYVKPLRGLPISLFQEVTDKHCSSHI